MMKSSRHTQIKNIVNENGEITVAHTIGSDDEMPLPIAAKLREKGVKLILV